MKKDPLGINGIINQINGTIKVVENDDLADSLGVDPVDLRMDTINELMTLKLSNLKGVYARCEEALNRIGSLDFSTPIETDDSQHVGNYIAHSLNMLMEELSSKVFPFQFEIIDRISDFVVVTDQKGHIIRANKRFLVTTGLEEEELVNKPIAEVFDTQILSIDLTKGFSIQEVDINILGKEKVLPVKLSISEVKGLKNLIIGYTFIAQLK